MWYHQKKMAVGQSKNQALQELPEVLKINPTLLNMAENLAERRKSSFTFTKKTEPYRIEIHMARTHSPHEIGSNSAQTS